MLAPLFERLHQAFAVPSVASVGAYSAPGAAPRPPPRRSTTASRAPTARTCRRPRRAQSGRRRANVGTLLSGRHDQGPDLSPLAVPSTSAARATCASVVSTNALYASLSRGTSIAAARRTPPCTHAHSTGALGAVITRPLQRAAHRVRREYLLDDRAAAVGGGGHGHQRFEAETLIVVFIVKLFLQAACIEAFLASRASAQLAYQPYSSSAPEQCTLRRIHRLFLHLSADQLAELKQDGQVQPHVVQLLPLVGGVAPDPAVKRKDKPRQLQDVVGDFG